MTVIDFKSAKERIVKANIDSSCLRDSESWVWGKLKLLPITKPEVVTEIYTTSHFGGATILTDMKRKFIMTKDGKIKDRSVGWEIREALESGKEDEETEEILKAILERIDNGF